MSEQELELCFNLWMERYLDDPSKFTTDMDEREKFLQERNEGRIPSYGEMCVAYLAELKQEIEL